MERNVLDPWLQVRMHRPRTEPGWIEAELVYRWCHVGGRWAGGSERRLATAWVFMPVGSGPAVTAEAVLRDLLRMLADEMG